MREIEIKARVEQLDDIRAVFKQKGIALSEPVAQHDEVWGMPGVIVDNTSPWLRLRTESKSGQTRHLLTLKRSVTGQLDSIEHETEVSDPGEMTKIIQELGFELYSDLTKTRQKAHVGDIEICLDSVKDLGEFIEAEKLTDDDVDYQNVIDELWRLLRGFGVNYDDEVTDGYDTLMNKKLGKE